MLKRPHFRSSLPALLLAVVVGWATLLSGCAYPVYEPGHYKRPQVRYRSPYYYDYHYYPSVGVYFNLYSGRYYYRARNRWMHSAHLPPHVYIGPRDRIHLRIWADLPYRYYDTHRKRYHPHPAYRRHWDRDRFERRYNRQHHQRYIRRYRR